MSPEPQPPGGESDDFQMDREGQSYLDREDDISESTMSLEQMQAFSSNEFGARNLQSLQENERRERDEQAQQVQRLGRGLKGCLPVALLGALGLIVAILVVMAALPDEEGRLRPTDEVLLGPSRTPSESPRESSSETPSESPSEIPGSDTASAPSVADLPPGAMLFTGTSGGPIGCIPCDGQSRFLSLRSNGVVVGNGEMLRVATPWTVPGQITSFGARLSGPNKGRYGVNLFYPETMEYGPGVALEIGQQSAVYQWTPERDGTVKVGVPAVIIVGEGGNIEAKGTQTLEWWFVFQPD